MSAFLNSPSHTGTDLSVTLVLWKISGGWPRAAARVKHTTLSLSALLLLISPTQKQVVDLSSGKKKSNILDKIQFVQTRLPRLLKLPSKTPLAKLHIKTP